MAHQVQTKNNRRKHHVVATRTDSSIGAIGHFTPYMRAARSSALLSFTCRHGISALFLVRQFFFFLLGHWDCCFILLDLSLVVLGQQ